MPPRLRLCNSLAVRTRYPVGRRTPVQFRIASCRSFSGTKEPGPLADPNQDALGNVNEEAADIGKTTGETQPDLEQGTLVTKVLERDEDGMEKAPKVVNEELKENEDVSATLENILALAQMRVIAEGKEKNANEDGHKFGLPTLPISPTSNIKHRYDPVVAQVTGLLMRHGKLGVAQRNMSYILNHLRTSPPPTTNPVRPLLPGSPPPHHLPLNPVLYLTIAIDSVAPLLRLRSQKGAAGGGQALQIPVPLGLRQRRRTAIQWILEAASKKPSRGSGRGQFAKRVAEEIINVVEGRSSAWEKRASLHKSGTTNRANVMYSQQRRRRF